MDIPGKPKKDNMGHLLSQDAPQLLQKESTVSFGGTDQVTWSRTLWQPRHPTELALSVPLGVGPTAQPHGETSEDRHSSGGAASSPPASPQVMVPPEPFVPGPHQYQREASVIAPMPPSVMKRPNTFGKYLSSKLAK